MSNKRKDYEQEKIKQLSNKYGISERTAYRWLDMGLVNDSLVRVAKEEKIRPDPNEIIEDCLALLEEVEDYTLEGSILPKIEALKRHRYISKAKYTYIISKLKRIAKHNNKISLVQS